MPKRPILRLSICCKWPDFPGTTSIFSNIGSIIPHYSFIRLVKFRSFSVTLLCNLNVADFMIDFCSCSKHLPSLSELSEGHSLAPLNVRRKLSAVVRLTQAMVIKQWINRPIKRVWHPNISYRAATEH